MKDLHTVSGFYQVYVDNRDKHFLARWSWIVENQILLLKYLTQRRKALWGFSDSLCTQWCPVPCSVPEFFTNFYKLVQMFIFVASEGIHHDQVDQSQLLLIPHNATDCNTDHHNNHRTELTGRREKMITPAVAQRSRLVSFCQQNNRNQSDVCINSLSCVTWVLQRRLNNSQWGWETNWQAGGQTPDKCYHIKMTRT